jgi:RHS repeat-associated protein
MLDSPNIRILLLAAGLAFGAGPPLRRPLPAQDSEFRRGDADADGRVIITDGIFTLNFLFLGGPEPPCRDAADADDRNVLNLTDAVYLFNFLFLGGPPPPSPGPRDCGPDPTPDTLDCRSFPLCVPNLTPEAAFSLDPASGQGPLTVSFDASASSDPDGRIVSFRWDFGDGETGEGRTTGHVFLDAGEHTVTLTVRDDDGAEDTATGRVTVSPYVVTLVETSPRSGETGVAVTRETVLRFNGRVSEASVKPAAIHAEFTGLRIPARLHTSSDRRTVILFYGQSAQETFHLPPNALVRVTVDGNRLLDDHAQAVDADGDGVPGGVATIDFSTLNVGGVPGTSICGRVFASELVEGGDCGAVAPEQGEEIPLGGPCSINRPLQGVRITVDGAPEIPPAFTDAMGDFRLEPAPAGRFFVFIDGATAPLAMLPDGTMEPTQYPDGPYYPRVGKAWETVPGIENKVGNIFLPLIPRGALSRVSETEETVIRFSDEFVAANPQFRGVELMVPPDSVYCSDGRRAGDVDLRIGIAPVAPDRLPGPLPPGLPIRAVITIQVYGAEGCDEINFDRPVPICLPNLNGLRPGEKSGLWSFNHDTGRFEVVGPMTAEDVDGDGIADRVCSDPGFGILAPGWHGDNPNCATADPENPEGQNPDPKKPQGKKPNDQTKEGENGDNQDDDPKDDCNVTFRNGEEFFDVVDLQIPGRGELHFTMERRYRSRLIYDGPLGHNWDFRYNESLVVDPGTGNVTRQNGFGHLDDWVRNPDGTYRAPLAFFNRLVREPGGTFILREPNGLKHYYRSDGRLWSLEDRNGNTMLFDYDDCGDLDVVVDPYGREIDFVFEGECSASPRRLRKIIDFTGRTVEYIYDPAGDLVEVRSPQATRGAEDGLPQVRTERYSYHNGFEAPDLNHNIATRTLPEEVARRGPPSFVWTYGTDPESVDFDRVVLRTKGGLNHSLVPAGGEERFEYREINAEVPPEEPNVERRVTRHTDRNGNVEEYFYDERGSNVRKREYTRGVRPGIDPEFYETRMEYDTDGQLTRTILPEGNEVLYEYGSGDRETHRNLTRITRRPGPRGGGPDLVTTITYEPLFQQLASTTDPRGHTPGYEPPLGAASAERYTTRFIFDYQEGNEPIPEAVRFVVDVSGIARGLGDRNGDGRSDQVAGNIVQSRAPSVLLRAGSEEAQRLGTTTQEIVTDTWWNDRGQAVRAIDPEGNVAIYDYFPEDDPDGDGRRQFSMYVELEEDDPASGADDFQARRGYLARIVVDAEDSPRRRSSCPAEAPCPPAALETAYRYDAVGNVIERRNPRGVVTRIVVNELNEPVETIRGSDVTAAVARGELPALDKVDLLSGRPYSDPLQYFARSFYDHNGRVVRAEVENRDGPPDDDDPAGLADSITTTFVYDILNNLVERTAEVTGGRTLTWRQRYDANENLTEVIQPELNRVVTAYDERDLVFTVTRGAGSAGQSTTQTDYDLNGNRRRFVDAEDNDGDGLREETHFVYDGFDRPIAAIDPLGNQAQSFYDPASNVIETRVMGHQAGQPGGPLVPLSDLFARHDELNRAFESRALLFVASGFTVARPVEGMEPDGRILLDGDADGFVTTFQEYDALSRLTVTVEDDGEKARSIYDGASRLRVASDHLGNSVTTTYDRNSNPVEVVSFEVASPAGVAASETYRTVNVYDQLDRLVRTTDNAGQTTYFAYDSRDNLVYQADPEGPDLDDPLGLFPAAGQVGAINRPGNTTALHYDGLDRQFRQVSDLRLGGRGGTEVLESDPENPDGRVTLSYEYDGNSRLRAIVDDSNNQTRFAYDELDRKTRHTFADGSFFQFVYDGDDNVREVTDPNGTVVTKTYDRLHRLVRADVDHSASAPRFPVGGTTQELFQYDGLSRLTLSADNNGLPPFASEVCEYVYDSLSRLLEERQYDSAAPGDLARKAVTNVFSGDAKRLSCTYPGGRAIRHDFDRVDRILRTYDDLGGIATSSWIGPGYRELFREIGNATALSFLDECGESATGYDAVKRLTCLKVLRPGGGSTHVEREYGYNRADQRTFERRVDDQGLTDSYDYDSTYRVVGSSYDAAGTGVADRRDVEAVAYTYDGVGNRRRVETTEGGAASGCVYQVNSLNEYTQVCGENLQYDLNGNLTADASRAYVYDYKNRLVEVRERATDSPFVRYLYTSDNRRVRKILLTENEEVASDSRYFYDGWQVCEERDEESDATLATYVWSPVYIDELVQFQRTPSHPQGGGGTFYAHQDARADVVALTTEGGNIAERYRFDDFGKVDIGDGAGWAREDTESALGNPYLFQGRRLDPETGFYYFRNRYYSPGLGRFLQRDPVWDAGNVGGQYAFVGNSPSSNWDALGLCEEGWGDWFWNKAKGLFKDLTGISDVETSFGAASAEWQYGSKLYGAGYAAAGAIQSVDAASNLVPGVGFVKGAVKKGAKEGVGFTIKAVQAGIEHADEAVKAVKELGEGVFGWVKSKLDLKVGGGELPQFSNVSELGFPVPANVGMNPRPGYGVDFRGNIYPHEGVVGVASDATKAKTAGGARKGLQRNAEGQGLDRPPGGELHEVPTASGVPGRTTRVEAIDETTHRGAGRYPDMHRWNPVTGRYEGGAEQVARSNRGG